MPDDTPALPLVPLAVPPQATPVAHRAPLVPENSAFLQEDHPVAAKVEAFLAQAMAASADRQTAAHALVPWMCDVLQSMHSLKAYGRDLVDFARHMEAQGIDPLKVTADHVKLYKRAQLEAGLSKATVARRLSVIRGTYKQLAAKGLIAVADAAGFDANAHLPWAGIGHRSLNEGQWTVRLCNLDDSHRCSG